MTLSTDLVDFAGPLGESFVLYPLLFPLVIFWHFFDFLHRQPISTGILSRLSAHKLFIFVVFFDLVLFIIMTLRVLEYNSCNALPDAYFHQCIVGPQPWLMFPWLAMLAITAILCLLKAIVSIHSLLQKKP